MDLEKKMYIGFEGENTEKNHTAFGVSGGKKPNQWQIGFPCRTVVSSTEGAPSACKLFEKNHLQ